jgi:hypothetical protein
MHPKPPFPCPKIPFPNPARLHRRKRVTIIAGFQCVDGIILCADTEQGYGSTSSNKSQTRKARLFPFPGGFLAIAGAGDGGLIDYTILSLVRHLGTTQYDLANLESVLNEYARRIFREHIRPYAGFPLDYVPDISFLIAVQTGGQCRLFKWERNYCYAVPPMTHTSIGIGMIQSEQLISEQQFFLPIEQMLLYAVRLMNRVKKLVQGCGGKTEVFSLHADGRANGYGILTVDAIESLTDEIDNFYLEHALAFVANTLIRPEAVEQELTTHRRSLVDFRERYRNLLPFLTVVMQPESMPSASQTSAREP